MVSNKIEENKKNGYIWETNPRPSASEARFLPRDHQVGSTKASLTFSYPRVFVLPRMQRGTEVVSKCDLYNIEKSSKSSI